MFLHIYVILFSVKGIWSGTLRGTFYRVIGTTSITSTKYPASPLSVGNLSSAAAAEGSFPSFVFVPGQEMDSEAIVQNRGYSCGNTSMTFPSQSSLDPSVLNGTVPGSIYLFVEIQQSSVNFTNCIVYDTISYAIAPVNVTNDPNNTNIAVLDVFLPGIAIPMMFCDDPIECTYYASLCSDLINVLDDSYTSPLTPLVLSATDRNEIKATIPSSSNCGTIVYQWRMIGVNDDQETFFQVPSSILLVADEILVIYEYRLNPGMYIVFLEVTTDIPFATYFEDYIYVQFVVPELQPIIAGPTIRSIDSSETSYITAYESSDPAFQISSIQSTALNADWLIFTSSTVNASDIENCVATFPNCSLLTTSEMGYFNTYSITYNGRALEIKPSYLNCTWALVIFRLTNENRVSSALTALHFQTSVLLHYTYSCIHNCYSTNTIKSPSGVAGFEVSVNADTSVWSVSYNRSLLEWDGEAFVPSAISLQGGALSDSLSETDESLEHGKLYLMLLDVGLDRIIPDPTKSRAVSISILKRINYVPYGGTCSIDRTAGIASSTVYTVSCNDWMDEGERYTRDGTLDVNSQLSYMVVQRNGGGQENILVVSGNPSMSFVALVGNDSLGHSATIAVKVLDIYSEAAEDSFTITSEPLMDVTVITPDATGAALIQNFTLTINATFYNQNDIDMSIPVGRSAAQQLNSIQVPPSEVDVPRTIDEPGVLMDIDINDNSQSDNNFNNYLSALYNTSLDPATVAIREGIELITNRINYIMVQRVNSGHKYYDQGYIDQLTQCFTALISVRSYVTDNTKVIAEQALATLAAASGDIWQSHAQSEDQQITSKTQLVDMSGNILGIVVPDNLNQARVVYDLSSALGQIDDVVLLSGPNMSKAVEDSNVSPTERGYLYLKSQQQLQEELSRSKSLAKATSQSIEEMTDDILETTELCTGCSQLLGSGNMIQNVSVLPIDDLKNVTLSAKSSSINVNLKTSNTSSTLSVSVSQFEKNIFMYDSDYVSSLVAYGVMHVVLGSGDTVTLDEVSYEQTVDQVDRDVVYPYVHDDDVSKFSLHRFIYRSPVDEVCLNLEPLDTATTSRYEVYLRYTEAPTVRDYDVTFTISGATDWVTCIGSSLMRGHSGITYLGIQIIQGQSQSRKKRDDAFASHVDSRDTSQIQLLPEVNSVSTSYKRYALRRRKRQANNSTVSAYPPYYFAAITASCLNWDETKTVWNSDTCKLTWVPALNKVRCLCRNVPQMTFGTSFFVAPATIDFSSAFLKFSPKSQAAVIGAILVVFIIYGLLLVWARRADHKDMLKWGILPLADNYEDDRNMYLISIHTGLRLGAGTESRIGFILGGHRTDTGVREMYDGVRKQFPAGSILQFLMTTQFHLGQLTHMRIWHDNSGQGNMAAWYLSRVTVYDMKKKEMYNFLCEQWIDVETCNSESLERTLSATNPNTEHFDYTFMNHAKRTLSDDHTWISFMYRPTFSNFTRAQRVTCAILFIFVNMVVNAMYYNPAEEYETDTLLEIGPCRLNMKQLSVSIITALITTPSTFLIVVIFKMSRRPTIAVNEKTPQSKYEPESQTDFHDKKKASCCGRFCSHPKLEKVPVFYIEDQNKKCMLPRGFSYVGWFLALGGIVTSAFFVLMYSIEWGEQKSGEWLATFILSLLQSVFLVDPIKVVLFAFCLAMVKKTLESNNFNKVDPETAEIMSKGVEQSDELPRQQLTPMELKVAKDNRKVESRWNRIVLDLVFNLLSIWLLLSICYSNTNINSYHIHDAILNSMCLNSTGDDEFNQISSTEQFYKWLNYTAIPKLFPEQYLNGETLHWTMREYIDGLVLYRLGPPRLRQFRIEKESCHLPKIDTKDCYRGYELSREETRDFCIGWGIPPCNEGWTNSTTTSWHYTDLETTDSLPMLGYIATYAGDGYFMTMDINRNLSIEYLQELYDQIWIDRNTRAVLLEFTVFSPNVNMFAYSMFFVEFPASGGAVSSFSIYPARVYQYSGSLGSYIFFCEIVGLLFLVLLAAQLVYGWFSFKCKAFKKFWFVLDFLRLCVLITTVGLYIVRKNVLSSAIAKFQDDKRTFVDFYQVTFWNQLVIYMLGVSVFMATIRVLKILEGNKNIYIISSVFAKLASDLFWFSILFFFFITVFAMLGYLLFGSRLYAYMSMYSSLRTLFVTLMGKNRFTEMNESDPILAKVYFFCFVCIISMIMFSIILSSLNQCIFKVTKQFDELTNKQDAFQYGFNKIAVKLFQKDSEKLDKNRVFPFRDVNKRESTMSF